MQPTRSIKTTLFLLPLFALAWKCQGQSEGWQQRVDHRIEVRLDDEKDLLHGEEWITYINRSSTPLQCIYFHLWPEAYSEHSTALSQQLREHGDLSLFYASPEERGWMDSLDFEVDGKDVPLYRDKEHPDIGRIRLNSELKPGDTIRIHTPFRVKVPDAKFSRMGAKGDAYRITQWYPKPAVYDENGWNTMPYLQQGEFLNEFGSYDVTIRVPSNYTVGATGKLVNSKAEKERLERMAEKTQEKDEFSLNTSTPPSSDTMKTLHYRADSVTDFAWFADKRYRVLQERIPIPRSDKKVLARVLFTDHQLPQWVNAMEYVRDALYYYSLWVGPYPHDRITVVSSRTGVGGGMEYPTICVIGPTNSPLGLERVIAHEVGHNWFQAILASDERRHPWMDEGLNSYYEHRYMSTKYPDLMPFEGLLPKPLIRWAGLDDEDPIQQQQLMYKFMASRGTDQPISLHSTEFTSGNYGSMVYAKGALLFQYLENYIGVEDFDNAIRSYYRDLRFSHPKPRHLTSAFRHQTGKDLSPFLDEFLHTTGKIDMKLKKVNERGAFKYGEQYRVTVKNQGDIAAPLPLNVIDKDSMTLERWIEGVEGERKIQLPYHTGEVMAFAIDGKKKVPEIDRQDNRYRTRTLFPKTGRIRFEPFFGLEEANEHSFHYFPALGWNAYDGFMSGIGLHDQGIFPEALDFAIAPMYAWESNRISGIGEIGLNAWSDDSPILDHLRVSLSGRRFSFSDRSDQQLAYNRLKPEIELWYSKADARSPHRHRTKLEVPMIDKADGSVLEGELERFWKLEQRWTREDPLLPMEGELEAIHHEEFTRLSARWEGAFRYNSDQNELRLRFFGGKFLRAQYQDPIYNWQMDGRSGKKDFLFEHYYFARSRSTGTLSQQFARTEGGFRTPTALGSSNDWIASAGATFELPVPNWPTVELFYTHGWSPDPFSGGVQGIHEGGVSVSLLEDIFEVHLPLLLSPTIEEEHSTNEIGVPERIRFELRLDRIEPFERLRTQSL